MSTLEKVFSSLCILLFITSIATCTSFKGNAEKNAKISEKKVTKNFLKKVREYKAISSSLQGQKEISLTLIDGVRLPGEMVVRGNITKALYSFIPATSGLTLRESITYSRILEGKCQCHAPQQSWKSHKKIVDNDGIMCHVGYDMTKYMDNVVYGDQQDVVAYKHNDSYLVRVDIDNSLRREIFPEIRDWVVPIYWHAKLWQLYELQLRSKVVLDKRIEIFDRDIVSLQKKIDVTRENIKRCEDMSDDISTSIDDERLKLANHMTEMVELEKKRALLLEKLAPLYEAIDNNILRFEDK